MGVVRAQIQTVEEIYRLIWTAVANRRPIKATYQGRLRLFCPYRLGRNREGGSRAADHLAARPGEAACAGGRDSGDSDAR